MDRLVKADTTELKLRFTKREKSETTFKLTNLMHTMSIAISLSTSNPTSFTFPGPTFTLIPPLSTATLTLRLARPLNHPPLSSPLDNIIIKSSAIPTGKASSEDLRRLFSRPPGTHVYVDRSVSIALVGPHVVEHLFCPGNKSPEEISFLLPKALSGCHMSELNSLLRSAAKCGYTYFITSLLDAGADPNYREPDSHSPSILSLAVQSADSESVRTIIESGYSLDPSDKLLLDAAELDRVDLMKILCAKFEKINLESIDSLGRTAIHIATIKANFEAVKFLISIGSNPDVEDLTGWTPLHYAASEGRVDIVELLVKSSTYAKYSVSKHGDTAFSLAVEKGHSRLYDLLHMGDVLHAAASEGNVKEVERCLAEGAKVDSMDQNGWTPLHRAAFKGKIECVKVLLNNGAQVDIVENSGRTALRLAIEAGHLRVVFCLKDFGAKPSGKVTKGCELGRIGLDCFNNHHQFSSPIF